ncbi:hypothetical protein EUGRSUZ_H00194, partial [Eucalyptus grandis]
KTLAATTTSSSSLELLRRIGSPRFPQAESDHGGSGGRRRGCGPAEEEDVQEVLLPGGRPGRAPRHVHGRARQALHRPGSQKRGLKRKPMALIKKLRKAKREAPPGEKPEPVRTHLRNMIIVPEMIGSIIGVYNGKTFNQVEIKPEMIGHYLAEFSISYKPVKHGRPGIGATHSSRFIPLK